MENSLFLTLFTMTMTIILCLRKNAYIEYTIANAIVVNILGYIIGTSVGILMNNLVCNTILAASITTFLTTELLGWGSLLGLKIINKKDPEEIDLNSKRKEIKWLSLFILAVIFLRAAISLILSTRIWPDNNLSDIMWKVLSDTIATLVTSGITFLFLWKLNKHAQRIKRNTQYSIIALFLIIITAIETGLIYIQETYIGTDIDIQTFWQLVTASFLVEVAIFCIVYMIIVLINTRKRILEEKLKADQARFSYQRLKVQLNPHFLFNSLNILDCLVREEKTEQASEYIHKLASIYRYFLKNENETLVSLSDEMEFVEEYIDLMKIRFQDKFQVTTDIAPQLLNKKILPSSIQLLLENAIKHNAISADKPLKIEIKTEEDNIKIINNLIPKIGEVESSKIGQQYIIKHYSNLTTRPVEITKSDSHYSVTLPLL